MTFVFPGDIRPIGAGLDHHRAASRQVDQVDGQATRVNAVAFAPDGRALASAGRDGAVKLWRGGPP